ncbi:MAG: CHAT domain-containing tetratricopeptide repeat protein [bacterium]
MRRGTSVGGGLRVALAVWLGIFPLLISRVGRAQSTAGDSAYASAIARFWRADTLATSSNPADLLRAIALWKESAATFAATAHNDMLTAMLYRIAESEHRAGARDSALAYYARALPRLRAMGDWQTEGSTLNDMGRIYGELGQDDSAFVFRALALQLQRKFGDRQGEASTLNGIGLLFSQSGRLDSALAYYNRALSIRRAIGDRSGEATSLNNLGGVQSKLGRSDSALFYFREALVMRRGLGNRFGEAVTLTNIGGEFHDRGRADSALANYSLSLLIRREVGDRDGEATTLDNMGELFRATRRGDSATVLFEQALRIRHEIGDRRGEAISLNNVGLMHYQGGRLDSALAYYARSAALHRELGDRANAATTLANIGFVRLTLGGNANARAAAAMFDSSAAMRARVRRSAGGDANAISMSEQNTTVFAAWSAAWSSVARSESTAASAAALASSIVAAERGRAQALRDLLDRHRQSGGQSVASAALFSSDTMPGADLALEATRLLAPLRASHTALLYYLSDGDTLRAWFLSARGVLRALPAMPRPRDELASTIALVRTKLGANGAAARRGFDDVAAADTVDSVTALAQARPQVSLPTGPEDALARLSADVLPPELEALLRPDEELVIVPHGAIGQVPFASLTLRGDTMPLGMRNPIRYAPSLRALAAAEATRAPSPRRALVVGNPAMPEVRTASGATRRLVPLDGAEEEARWIARQLGTQALIGRAASENAVRLLLPRATVVHLATHGLAYGTESRVRDSYVALAPGNGDDGLLTLGELLDDDALQLSADLIVLSACQTGLGEAREAEGTVGLQRGLLARGARSVLVSLWSVDDEATRALMERFYAHWLGTRSVAGVSKAEALRRAERDVRSDRAHADWRTPRFWAAFQLVGAH